MSQLQSNSNCPLNVFQVPMHQYTADRSEIFFLFFSVTARRRLNYFKSHTTLQHNSNTVVPESRMLFLASIEFNKQIEFLPSPISDSIAILQPELFLIIVDNRLKSPLRNGPVLQGLVSRGMLTPIVFTTQMAKFVRV